MRIGLIASTAGHVAVLLWGVATFPGAKPFDVPPVDTVPVDLVPISDITKLRIGEQDAEVREIEATRASEAPEPDVPNETPPSETAAAEPAPPVPAPAPAPDPAPTPPEPAPEPPEPAPEPAPAPEPTPEPAPEPEPEAQAPPLPTVVPRVKPTPPPERAPDREEFNPNQIAALLNKVDPAGGGTPDDTEQPASLGSRQGLSGVTMTQSELDALRGQISRCWNPPAGAAGAQDLRVRLKVLLTRSGDVDRRPEIMNSSANPAFIMAAESAQRAVLRCAPYTLPAEKFDAWKEVIINFDPRELLGG